jgi:hypothetical protein
MKAFSDDQVTNAIYQGIKRGIDITLGGNCFGSCVILIYSAMDTMASLAMPAGQAEVGKADFVRWADRYIHFPCQDQITGEEFYGARCAMLHSYGAASRLSRAGRVGQVAYMDLSIPEVRANPAATPPLVLVSISALRDAAFRGIDQSLIDMFADTAHAPIAEARLNALMKVFMLPNVRSS